MRLLVAFVLGAAFAGCAHVYLQWQAARDRWDELELERDVAAHLSAARGEWIDRKLHG